MNERLIQITEAARTHFENVKADILNATTRIEHIRLTTLAQEAHQLLTDLEELGPDGQDSATGSATTE